MSNNASFNKKLNVTTPEKLLLWMCQNLAYHGISKEYLYSPEEVISKKLAHCWESCSLEYVILDELNLNPSIVYLENSDSSVTHTLVIYTNNKKYYWFEWAWFKYQGIHSYNSEKALIEDIIKKFKKDNNLKLITKGNDTIQLNTNQQIYYNIMLKWTKLNLKDTRKYRQCVRIIITKGDKVLLGKKFINDEFVGYEFPGGGIEEGYSLEETVRKECLEEVGIKVTNITSLGIQFKYDVNYPNPERAKLYRGGEDTFFTAEFVSFNNKLHDSEGDALPYTWETIPNAIKLISNYKNSIYTPIRIEALNKVVSLTNNIQLEKLSLKYLNQFVEFREKSGKESDYVNIVDKDKAKLIIKEWTSGNKKGFILLDGKKIIGQLFVTVEKDKLILNLISVIKEYQGKGLGDRLINNAIELANINNKTKIELIVNINNDRARAFYERHGFRLYKNHSKTHLVYLKDLLVSTEALRFKITSNSNLSEW